MHSDNIAHLHPGLVIEPVLMSAGRDAVLQESERFIASFCFSALLADGEEVDCGGVFNSFLVDRGDEPGANLGFGGGRALVGVECAVD